MEKRVKEQLFESFKRRYHRAQYGEKKELLDEVCELFGWHRKHATRRLNEPLGKKERSVKQVGRKSKYGDPEFLKALHRVRKEMEFRNAKVIKANMKEWLPFIEELHGEFSVSVRERLLTISAATMDRYFKRARDAAGKGLSTTRPGKALRNEIEIAIGSQWRETEPGKMAADTVAHCGNTTLGQYVFSLDMVDYATHWTAQRAVWGKGAHGVLEATKSIENSLPFPLIALHVDNGTEFINYHYIRHYSEEPTRDRFKFSRSRAYRKNDNAHVEQKNWSVVRRYLGYDRLHFAELVPLINDLYQNEMNLYLNHFCPTFKIKDKILIKSRYKRLYDDPITPYQRVINSEFISQRKKDELTTLHNSLNPVTLRRNIERKLKNIYALLRKLNKSRSNKNVA